MRISSVVPASAPAHCAIYHQVGDCIMPREGVYGRTDFIYEGLQKRIDFLQLLFG